MAGVSNVHLTMAMNDYDHVRDIVDGTVPVDGVELTSLRMRVEEIFFRFVQHREWDLSEMSLAKFASMRAREGDVVGIPVFPSRAFRHSAFYVRSDSPLVSLDQLGGKRIGIPEWTMTATVYARGILAEHHGVALSDVSWFQAGLDDAGRIEGVAIQLPPGIECTAMRDRTLTDLLLAGEIDAVISARPSRQFGTNPLIRRLLKDPLADEQTYYERTGVFPIMHVVVLRTPVYEEHPWLAMNLFKAFDEAKRRSLERALDDACARFPIPWSAARADAARQVFGEDLWPYGLEANRPTLETFLRYAAEQGVTSRLLGLEELFVPEVQAAFRV